MKIRIGTRRSRLAMAQTTQMAELICSVVANMEYELVGIDTRGDKTVGPLTEVGGKGLFTAELEAGLRSGDIDLAVHSAKDMPAVMDEGLCIAAVPQREDPRDVLVSRKGPLELLERGAKVGTGSIRRAAMLRKARPDLQVVPIRGNVDTRLGKALGDTAELDAVVLAMAGLKRSGLLAEHNEYCHPIAPDVLIPCGGQGTIVLQTGSQRQDIIDCLAAVDHEPSRQALLAERSVLARLNASCQSCVAVYIFSTYDGWEGVGMAGGQDGSGMVCSQAAGDTAQNIADSLLQDLHQVSL